MIDFLVRKPNNPKPISIKYSASLQIIGLSLTGIMLRSVNLNNQSRFKTIKICNETINGLLTLKPDRIIPKIIIPQMILLRRCRSSELLCSLYQFSLIWYRHFPFSRVCNTRCSFSLPQSASLTAPSRGSLQRTRLPFQAYLSVLSLFRRLVSAFAELLCCLPPEGGGTAQAVTEGVACAHHVKRSICLFHSLSQLR